MRIYSSRAIRLMRQISADVASILGIFLSFVYAHRVRTGILDYLPLADDISTSGEQARSFITGVADQMREIPFIGPSIAESFESSVGLPDQIVTTGEALSNAIQQFADLAWFIVVLIPLLAILGVWLPWRLRFVARSLATGRLRQTEAGIEILAVRAVANGPEAEVLRAHPRPARAVYEDVRVRDALAEIQLREYGHTLPTRVQ